MGEGKNRNLAKESEISKMGINIKKEYGFQKIQDIYWEKIITNSLRSNLPFIPRTHLSFGFRNLPYRKFLCDLAAKGILKEYRKYNRTKIFLQKAEGRCHDDTFTEIMFNIAIPFGKSRDFKKNEKMLCDAYIAWTDDNFTTIQFESLAKLTVIMNGEGSFNGYTHYQIPIKKENFTKCFFIISGRSTQITYHNSGRNGRTSLYIPSPKNETIEISFEEKMKNSRKRKYNESAKVSQSPPPTPESMDLEIDSRDYIGIIQIGEYYLNDNGDYEYHNKLCGKGIQLLSPSHLQQIDFNISPITHLSAKDLFTLIKKIKKTAIRETLPYLMLEFEVEEVDKLLEKTIEDQKKLIGTYEIQGNIHTTTQVEYRLEWKSNTTAERVFRTMKCIACNSNFDNINNLVIHLNTHYLPFNFDAIITNFQIIINVSFKGFPQDRNLNYIDAKNNYYYRKRINNNRRFKKIPKKITPISTIIFIGGKRMRQYVLKKYYYSKLKYDYTNFIKESSEHEPSDDALLALPFPRIAPDFATRNHQSPFPDYDWDEIVVANSCVDYPFATPNYYTDKNMLEGNYYIELPSEEFHSVRLERSIIQSKCSPIEKIYCLLWDKFVYENNIGTPILPHENMCKALIQFYLNYIFERDDRYYLHQCFLTHGNNLAINNYITVEERSKVFRFCSLDYITISDYDDIDFDNL
uniref:C2H2-type domain-containing protein n=1 Tax=Strongyloides papillosus TaxID=174720 RepID=A0A0N5C7Z2_STREA